MESSTYLNLPNLDQTLLIGSFKLYHDKIQIKYIQYISWNYNWVNTQNFGTYHIGMGKSSKFKKSWTLEIQNF